MIEFVDIYCLITHQIHPSSLREALQFIFKNLIFYKNVLLCCVSNEKAGHYTQTPGHIFPMLKIIKIAALNRDLDSIGSSESSLKGKP